MSTAGRLKWYSPEKFKEYFNVGDFVSGKYGDYSKVVQITAIGHIRFLAVDATGKETVFTQAQVVGWEKVTKPSNWP